MDAAIDLRARAVVERNHQRVLRRFRIIAGDGRDVLVVIVNFVYPALSVEILYRFAHLTPRQLLDYLFSVPSRSDARSLPASRNTFQVRLCFQHPQSIGGLDASNLLGVTAENDSH